jgi:membrane protease YdiL (CAAX protease family)
VLRAGIAAAKAGNAGWARDLLLRAVELDAGNVQAWLWLSEVADTPAEQRSCLEKVLSLEPDHEEARRRLEWLELQEEGGGPHEEIDERIAGTGREESWDEGGDALLLPNAQNRQGDGAQDEIGDGAQYDAADSVLSSAESATVPSSGVEVLLDATPSPEVEDLMREGIAAVRASQPNQARDLLKRVIEVDEGHVSAWLWLSYVADSAEEQARYVQQVLRLSVPDVAPQPVAVAALAGPGFGGVATATYAFTSREATVDRRAKPGPESLVAEAADLYESLRSAYAEWTSTWMLTAAAYMGGIAMAELLTTFVDPRVGLVADAVLLLMLFIHAAVVDTKAERAFLVALSFAPMIRILSLSMPLAQIPILYWYLIASVPLFAALLVAAPILGYSWIDLGLNLRRWPLQLAIGLTGIAFGAIEYLILRPEALAPSLQWIHLWWPALILLISTGLLEEMIFRGLLQRSAGDVLRRGAVLYVALLFAVLHIGYRSWVDFAFVLLVGLFFGWIVQRTRSLLGVTLSHGLTNIVLFLVMPFLSV